MHALFGATRVSNLTGPTRPNSKEYKTRHPHSRIGSVALSAAFTELSYVYAQQLRLVSGLGPNTFCAKTKEVILVLGCNKSMIQHSLTALYRRSVTVFNSPNYSGAYIIQVAQYYCNDSRLEDLNEMNERNNNEP